MEKSISRHFTKNVIKNIIGLLIGAIGGYLYYHYVGCASGGCAITSNPYLSILWGAVLGYLLFDMFKIKDKAIGQSDSPGGDA